MRPARRVLASAILGLAAFPAFACDTADDVLKAAQGEASRVTVISETSALMRALSFMIGHADEVQTAEQLIVIENSLTSEVVLIQNGCATLKAVAEPDLVAELLRRAKGKDEAKGELI